MTQINLLHRFKFPLGTPPTWINHAVLRIAGLVFHMDKLVGLPAIFHPHKTGIHRFQLPFGAVPRRVAGSSLDAAGLVFDVHIIAGGDIAQLDKTTAHILYRPEIGSSCGAGAISHVITCIVQIGIFPTVHNAIAGGSNTGTA